MSMSVKDAIAIWYMLRCLGISLTRPTDLFGGNFFGVVQSAENGELTKKHVAISYYHYYVWAAIAAKIVNAHWCGTHETFADLCTTANMFFKFNGCRTLWHHSFSIWV